MQDQPEPQELLRAVRTFLLEHAMPELEGRTRFHARVAANVIGIVERQIELAEAGQAQERSRLQALIGGDGSLAEQNARLASRIRSGELGPGDRELREHLWLTTLEKLAVDNPRYEVYRRETKR